MQYYAERCIHFFKGIFSGWLCDKSIKQLKKTKLKHIQSLPEKIIETTTLIQAADAVPLKSQEISVAEPSPQEINALMVLFNQGQYTEVVSLTQRMTTRFPQSGFVWKALAVALQKQGKDALSAMQKAAELLPHDVEAQHNLAVFLKNLGQLEAAAMAYRRVLKLKPELVDAQYNLGHILFELGQFPNAAVNYRQVVKKQANFAEAHCSLANALLAMGQIEAAVTSYRLALKIKPDFAEAYYNLGNAFRDLGQFDKVVESYRRALQIRPDFVDVHRNLGNALRELGQFEQALVSYRRALEIKPDFADVYCNIGNTLLDMMQFDKAMASYRQALVIQPDLVDAYNNMLFMQHYQSKQSAVTMFETAQGFGEMAARQAHPYVSWRKTPKSGQRLRVGLVSGDLGNHPVGYFVESILAACVSNVTSNFSSGSSGSNNLEFIAYSNYSRNDAVAKRIKACCHDWHAVEKFSDQQLAQKIHDDGIDILIDLSGHTEHNRLTMFAYKPAPVQVSWLGYFATTGVKAIDYLIADPWVLPPEEEIYFTEKIWRLPETRLCFTPPDVMVNVAPLPALTKQYITFACFNNLSKMNDDVVALWAKILLAMPTSRLFLKAKQLNEESVQQETIARFAQHGVGADRLMLEGAESREKYLAAYHQVDIALDPFPFPGGTTSVEGLWMGVPVLTLAGGRFLSRQGVGILANAGLQDWIASDADDYVARALRHASDVQALSELRSGLRQQVLSSPLFDAQRFAGHFEAALRGMWQRYVDATASEITSP